MDWVGWMDGSGGVSDSEIYVLWSSGLVGSCLRALYNHPIQAGMMGFGIE